MHQGNHGAYRETSQTKKNSQGPTLLTEGQRIWCMRQHDLSVEGQQSASAIRAGYHMQQRQDEQQDRRQNQIELTQQHQALQNSHAAADFRSQSEVFRSQQAQMEDLHLHQFYYLRDQIEKTSRRIFDGLYQLVKIKFGFSEHNSEVLQAKYASLVQERLAELQARAHAKTQQQQGVLQFSKTAQPAQNQQNYGRDVMPGYGEEDLNNNNNKNGFSNIIEEIFPHSAQVLPRQPPPFGNAYGNSQAAAQAQNMQYPSFRFGQNSNAYGEPTEQPIVQLSEQEMHRLQEQVESEMMERDRQLESVLVSALVQLDIYKQSLLQIVSKMREQAVASEKRQKQFVELLHKHEDGIWQAAQTEGEPPVESKEPFELGMLFAPLPQPMDRSSSFYNTLHQQQRSWPGLNPMVSHGITDAGVGQQVQIAQQKQSTDHDWLNSDDFI